MAPPEKTTRADAVVAAAPLCSIMSRDEHEVRAVYLTFPDESSAAALAEALVARRLVACVNVLPVGTSTYRWDDRVVREAEVVAVAKTTAGRVPEVLDAVRELHPYDVPCAVVYPAVGGLPDYVAWVVEETTRPSSEEGALPATGAPRGDPA